jgi:hypothetical protein
MSEMSNLFNNGQQFSNNQTVDNNDEKKQKVQDMKEAMKESLQNAEYKSRLHTLSDSLEIKHSLGYGSSGNIIEVKSGGKDGGRAVKPTSQIVGYQLTNVGSQPIPYTTEEFSLGNDGLYEGKVVEKTMAPGETINITRKYLAILTSQPEISFTLKNGNIVSPKRKFKNFAEELSAHYFKFSDDTKVNDDSVKISIDKDNKVLPEFVATFGYLNNPKAGRQKKAAGPKYTTQDLAANYIYKILNEQGM